MICTVQLKLKEVTNGYKEELKNTIALKRDLLEVQTKLSESEHDLRLLRCELAKQQGD